MLTPSLSTQEASDLLKKFGPNLIKERKNLSALKIFLSQFKNLLILILVVAALISLFSGQILEGLVIIFIVLLNALFGFWQEYHAQKAIQALKGMVVSHVRVIRDGQETFIEAKYLVPGDVIIIGEGDRIPADASLIETAGLEVNEASLTGESVPVEKNLTTDSKIFMGTIVAKGRAKAVVSDTGMETRFGKIAFLIDSIKDSPTPFQKQINLLSKNLAAFALLSAGFIFLVGLTYGKEFFNMLLTVISLAVAVVPEGLPAVITITLAIGVQRMAKASSITRQLSAIETLGSVDIIATDKTGTLTKNEMDVRNVWLDGNLLFESKIDSKTQSYRMLTKIAVLANTASLAYKVGGNSSGDYDVLGDQTEGALLKFAVKNKLNIDSMRNEGRLLKEFGFDSVRKLMTVIWEEKGEIFCLSKGAPEEFLEKSQKILIKNKVVKFTDNYQKAIESALEDLASKGLRVIALAYTSLSKRNLVQKEIEKDFTFVGLFGIADPPRPEVKNAIQVARLAGIETVMITGDNPLTALAIGKEIGLVEKGDEILTGKDLDRLSETELSEKIEKVRIFARITPEHKLRIVKTLQNKGNVVAVTGDGVNDSPALKQADVGIAMGKIGTDVAKETADIVLTNDNYASIVKAVEEGRVIYDNIIKSTKYLLSCNVGELLTILIAVLINLPNPLTPIQILWMNLVTDGFPALSLSTDPKDPSIMKRLPRSKLTGVMSLIGIKWILYSGVFMAIATIAVFSFTLNYAGDLRARTVAFFSLIIFQLLAAIVVTNRKKWYTNKFLLASILLTLFLQLTIMNLESLRVIFDVN